MTQLPGQLDTGTNVLGDLGRKTVQRRINTNMQTTISIGRPRTSQRKRNIWGKKVNYEPLCPEVW